MLTSQKRFHFDNKNLQKQIGPYWLYQIGDLSCIGDYYVERHRQFVYEVTFIASGLGHIRVRDKWYEGKPGNVLSIASTTSTRCREIRPPAFDIFISVLILRI